jgi:hypothetical protein
LCELVSRYWQVDELDLRFRELPDAMPILAQQDDAGVSEQPVEPSQFRAEWLA